MSPFQPYFASESMPNQTHDQTHFESACDRDDDIWVEYDDLSGFTSGDVMSNNMHFGLLSHDSLVDLVPYSNRALGLDALPMSATTYWAVPARRPESGLGRLAGDAVPIGPSGFNTIPSVAAAVEGFGFDCPSRPPTAPPAAPPTALLLAALPLAALPLAAPGSPELHTCHICPPGQSAFTHKKDLKRHIDSVHETADAPTYGCRCGKGGVRKDNYLRHVLTCNKEHRDISYLCKCLSSIVERELHINHVRKCRYGFSRNGRPSAY
ncbi:hypothetical protein EKO27_g2423 [Xylaria grammica]|uniref:Uncharacterized protein n=1 Tax=Xylaria grammica TaxID=363999 RepID=A0A439DE58_9PEZI|nr:hypothetical protein EKO27_g2423 [Xylaria grammica]